tara:strand:+ start:3876 stop:4700 length:825 start_codon:yes stop_codon:yes gene_type:complete
MSFMFFNLKRGLGIGFLLIGLFMALTTRVITGSVIGVGNVSFLGFFGFIVFIIGAFLILQGGHGGGERGELERKLGQIKEVKVRRELLSDAHRAEKFASKGLDVNDLWDENKSYEENQKAFFDEFYDNVDREITDNFWKFKYRDSLTKKDYDENIQEYTNTEDFREFKEKALRMIPLWNEKVLSEEFIPLYMKESQEEAKHFPGMKVRTVYYGPKDLQGKSNRFYEKTARKNGEIVVAHEIINPEAIENPNQLKDAPHIHWELEYIMNKNFKFD